MDAAVARTLGIDAPWLRAATLPSIAVIVLPLVLVIVVVLANLPNGDDALAGYTLLGELALSAIVLVAARPIAARVGGWGVAFGLDRPVRGDGKRVAAWFGMQLLVRFAVAIVIAVAAPNLDRVGNLTGVDKLGASGGVMLLIAGALVAPFIEELAFRGILLRALMRRLPYWPAAGISSLIFAFLHAPEADSWANAITIVFGIYAFALVQCQLVRRTARLAPAIGVHATMNFITVILALTG